MGDSRVRGGGSRGRMPWNKTDPVNERMRFVVEIQKGDLSMVAACRKFGISRKTGFNIMERHSELGPLSPTDQRRAGRAPTIAPKPDVPGSRDRLAASAEGPSDMEIEGAARGVGSR